MMVKNMITKYRKKPVVIEAMQLNRENFTEAMVWCRGSSYSKRVMGPVLGISIETLEGTMHAVFGDWIIKGVNGEFYPCKHDIFEKTYDSPDVQGTAWEQYKSEVSRIMEIAGWNELAISTTERKARCWLGDDGGDEGVGSSLSDSNKERPIAELGRAECPQCKAAADAARVKWGGGGSPPSLPVQCPHKSNPHSLQSEFDNAMTRLRDVALTTIIDLARTITSRPLSISEVEQLEAALYCFHSCKRGEQRDRKN